MDEISYPLQDAVLLPKTIDDFILSARDPSSHRGHEDLTGIEHRGHTVIAVRSGANRQLST